MLLGHSKLDTTVLYTRVATFSLETKAGEAGAGVITWTAKPAQKHDPSNVRWIKDLSCRSSLIRDSLSIIRPNQSSRVQAPVLLKMNCGMH